MPQRGSVTADLTLEVGGLEERVVVEASPMTVQFKSSNSDLTIERQLVDQVPINGRNPYSLANLDPTINVTLSNENRPYHHAYANDYDAGGGTRRANDVLLDGVALGASYKTAYTPAVDAVEEITISKNSVDAENGHSLGGIISLNMKSGTNARHGSAYLYFRDPSLNSISDPTILVDARPGHEGAARHRAEDGRRQRSAARSGRTRSSASRRSSSGTTSGRCRSSEPCRPSSSAAAISASRVLNGRVRTIYNPFASTLDAAGRVVRPAFANNIIPASMLDPVAVKMLAADPAAEPARQRRQLAGQRLRCRRLLEPVAARRREHHRQLEDLRRATASSRPTSISRTRPTPGSSRSRAATATA